MGVLEEIAAERQRQMDVEGWTPEHDDGHFAGEMARAAAAYAIQGSMPDSERMYEAELRAIVRHGRERHATLGSINVAALVWPWIGQWWKPTYPRRNLVKAAALIVAEIERLDRRDRRNAERAGVPASQMEDGR